MSEGDISDLLGEAPKGKRGPYKSRRNWTSAPNTPLKALIKALGGPFFAAQKVGVSRQTIYNWLDHGYVSWERALDLETRFAKKGADRWALVDPAMRAMRQGD